MCVADCLSAVLVVSSGVGSHRAVRLLTKAVGPLLFQCAVDENGAAGTLLLRPPHTPLQNRQKKSAGLKRSRRKLPFNPV